LPAIFRLQPWGGNNFPVIANKTQIARQLFVLMIVQAPAVAAHAQAANPPPANIGDTNAPTVLPPIIVIGHDTSLTSPSADKAAEQKKRNPRRFHHQNGG